MAKRKEQRRWVFTGHVQGVGFRWTARSLAASYCLTGWVCNRPDGAVELVAQGSADTLDEFLEDLRSSMRGCIRGETCQKAPATDAFDEFEIRR